MRGRTGGLLVTLVVLGCGSVEVEDPSAASGGVGATSTQSSASASSSSSTSSASSGAGGAGGTGAGGAGGAGGTPCTGGGVPVGEALAAFAACMTLDDWTASGLGQLPSSPTLTNGQCMTCHAAAVGNVLLSDDIAATFEAHTHPPQLDFVVEGVGDPACTVDLAPSNAYADFGPSPTPHPDYLLSPEITQSLQTFFDLTYTKWQSGPCIQAP